MYLSLQCCCSSLSTRKYYPTTSRSVPTFGYWYIFQLQYFTTAMASIRPTCLNQSLLRSFNSARTSLYRQRIRWQSTPSSGQSQQAQPPPNISNEASRTTGASDPPAPRSGDSAMIRQEGSEGALVDHQPDFHAPIDHGTSSVMNWDCRTQNTANDLLRAFSPIPKRVMDGSEPGDLVAGAVLSGAPVDLQARTVR